MYILLLSSAFAVQVLNSPDLAITEIYDLIDLLSEQINSQSSEHQNLFRVQDNQCQQQLDQRQSKIEQLTQKLLKNKSQQRSFQIQSDFASSKIQRSSFHQSKIKNQQLAAKGVQIAEAQNTQQIRDWHKELLHHTEDMIRNSQFLQSARPKQLLGQLIAQSQLFQDKNEELALEAKAILDGILHSLTQIQDQQNSSLQVLGQLEDFLKIKIQELNTNILQDSKRLEELQKLKLNSETLCEDWKTHFEGQNTSRQLQNQVLNKLKSLMEQQYGPYSPPSIQADLYKENWDHSQDAYVYKSQEIWQHTQNQ